LKHDSRGDRGGAGIDDEFEPGGGGGNAAGAGGAAGNAGGQGGNGMELFDGMGLFDSLLRVASGVNDDETDPDGKLTVGGAMYTVDPRVKNWQLPALKAYALNHAEPRGKIVMACGTGKLAMGDTAILVEQITALTTILLCKSLSNDNQCQSMTV
jgi:hypothetical protein